MPPEPPPLPISATFITGLMAMQILFDRPLTPGPLAAAPWTAAVNITAGRRNWTPVAPPSAGGSTVSWGTFDAGPAFPGPDVVDYTPPPADVLGLTGVPAAPFAAFPVAVIP